MKLFVYGITGLKEITVEQQNKIRYSTAKYSDGPFYQIILCDYSII